jgi:hypothetical protein
LFDLAILFIRNFEAAGTIVRHEKLEDEVLFICNPGEYSGEFAPLMRLKKRNN